MARDEFPEPTEEELEEFMGPVEPFTPPPFTLDLNTAIVVDNLPVVGKEKFDRLTGVLRKLYEQLGRITEPDGLFMPFDDAKNTTLGFAFINFEQMEEAEHAVAATQNYKLGANILQVSWTSSDDENLPPPCSASAPYITCSLPILPSLIASKSASQPSDRRVDV